MDDEGVFFVGLNGKMEVELDEIFILDSSAPLLGNAEEA